MGLAVGLIHGAVMFAPTDLPQIHGPVTFAPSNIPMIGAAHVDAHVFMFVALTTLASIGGFGLMPAVRSARRAEARISRDGGRTTTARPATSLVRRALVTGQVALALVVLSAAGALGGAIIRLDRTPLGFDPQHLLFFRLDFMLPSSAIDSTNLSVRRFVDRLGPRLSATPGLGPLTTTLTLPFGGGLPSDQYVLEDARSGTDGRGGLAHFDHALDDYFGIMHVAIVRGRPIARTDECGSSTGRRGEPIARRRTVARQGPHWATHAIPNGHHQTVVDRRRRVGRYPIRRSSRVPRTHHLHLPATSSME